MTFETRPTDSLGVVFVDTHCHLDDESFNEDRETVLNDSRESGVLAWINVGFEPRRWSAALRMTSEISGMSHMLGVHPSSAQYWNDEVRGELVNHAESSNARAVGEIGFDFYRDNAPYEVQKRAFIDQLSIARDLGLPAVIHVRHAEDQLLETLEAEETLPRLVFHSFDGSERLTRFALSHDALIGVGGLATRHKSEGLRAQLKSIPLESMVLETDSPYLVPARQKLRRNTPAQVRTIAQFIADLLGRSIDDVARTTTSNAESVFGKLLP